MRSSALGILIAAAMLLLVSDALGRGDPPDGQAYPTTAKLTQGECLGVYKITVVSGRLHHTYVACPKGLTDPDLSVITRDVGPEDVIRLEYRVPIRNRPGPDIGVAQTFGGGDAINRIGDAMISANGVDWLFLPHQEFVYTGVRGAFFDGTDDEQFAINQVEVDLADLGVAGGAEVTTLYLRGAEYRTSISEWIPNFVWVVDLHKSPRPE